MNLLFFWFVLYFVGRGYIDYSSPKLACSMYKEFQKYFKLEHARQANPRQPMQS